MEIKSNVEINPENGKKRILVYIESDDITVIQTAFAEFNQFDKDDFKYRAKLEDLKETIHKIWTLTHPS